MVQATHGAENFKQDQVQVGFAKLMKKKLFSIIACRQAEGRSTDWSLLSMPRQ